MWFYHYAAYVFLGPADLTAHPSQSLVLLLLPRLVLIRVLDRTQHVLQVLC